MHPHYPFDSPILRYCWTMERMAFVCAAHSRVIQIGVQIWRHAARISSRRQVVPPKILPTV